MEHSNKGLDAFGGDDPFPKKRLFDSNLLPASPLPENFFSEDGAGIMLCDKLCSGTIYGEDSDANHTMMLLGCIADDPDAIGAEFAILALSSLREIDQDRPSLKELFEGPVWPLKLYLLFDTVLQKVEERNPEDATVYNLLTMLLERLAATVAELSDL